MNKLILPNNCEIDVAEMCNLSCGFCSHNTHYFTNKDPFYTYEGFVKDFGILKDLVHFDTLHMMGGEPLLNKELVKYLRFAKETQICNFLNIITNGILLHEVDEEIFTHIQGLTVSIYPSTAPELQKQVQENAKWVKQKYPKILVTTHLTPWFFKMSLIEKHKDEATLQKVFENCYRAQQNDFSTFNGRMYRCFMARKQYPFLNKWRALVKDDFEHLKDGVPDSIEITPDLTPEKIDQFLNQKQPLEACKWCLGCSGKRHGHTQIKKGDIDYATLNDLDIEGGAKFLEHYIHRRCELENTRHQVNLKKFLDVGQTPGK